MSKHYCTSCGFAFSQPKDGWGDYNTDRCNVCGSFTTVVVPTYETVAQWEERKGRKYPDTAPVYVLEGDTWHLYNFAQAQVFPSLAGLLSVVATEAGTPPDDWRPE